MYIDVQVMYSLLFSAFNETLILSTDFRNILKNKSHEDPLGVELFHAGGRKLRVPFRNFAKAPKELMRCVCVFVPSW
jgi:hypothetical protein